MRKFPNRKKTLELLIIISLAAVAILPRLLLANINSGYWWDEAVYLGLAKNVVTGVGYLINNSEESFRPPLFPYILSALYPNDNLTRFVSPIFGIISVFALYLFTKELYGKKTALVASFFLATSELYFFYGQKILTETIFATFFVLTIISIFFVFEKKKIIFLIPAGIFFTLSFLTRYTAVILIPAFVIYFVFKFLQKEDRKYFSRIILSKEFLFAIFISLFLLLPWFYNNYANHGDLVWPIKDQLRQSGPEFYSGPWYFYISNSLQLFGISALFAIPFLFSVRKKDSLILIFALAILFFFSFGLERKEFRYLISFAPIFYTVFAVGAVRLAEKYKVNKIFVYTLVAIMTISSLVSGPNLVVTDSSNGTQIIEAAKYVKENSDDNYFVIAENYPVVNYVSGRKVFAFPETFEEFTRLVSSENISFVVVDNFEPTTPDYAKSLDYAVVKIFQKENERVIVYRIY